MGLKNRYLILERRPLGRLQVEGALAHPDRVTPRAWRAIPSLLLEEPLRCEQRLLARRAAVIERAETKAQVDEKIAAVPEHHSAIEG